MSRYYLLNMGFIVPLKGGFESDTINLNKGDIIEIRYYNEYEKGSLLKILGDKFFKDSHIYIEFINHNKDIFIDVTKEIKRDIKINKVIKKGS